MKKQNQIIDPFVLPFPEYTEGKLNSIVLVIKEEVTFEKTPDSEEPIEKKRTKENAENFLFMLNGLAKTYGLSIDASGTRDQMAERLYKKGNRELLTQEEAVLYAISWVNSVSENAAQPSQEDLIKWRAEKNKGDDYEEHF